MGNQVNTPPTAITAAGQDYNYPDPPVFVTVTLTNAPVDPDHQNVGLNKTAYDDYIAAQVAATEDPSVPGGAAWVVPNVILYDPEHDLKAATDYDTAMRLYNYGRIDIPSGRSWYVFYTPEYLNPTTTRLIADLDEFPSFEWGLGYSMIERGHIAVAASQDDTYGDQYLTAPEPVEAPPVRGVVEASLLGSAPDAWTVLVVSANDLRGTGPGYPFWGLHSQNTEIASAANLGSAATINSEGVVQTTIPQANYPWSTGSGDIPPSGTPENGYVPDMYLATIIASTPPLQAELNTATALETMLADHPEAYVPGIGSAPANAAGYWSRALDEAIHADPSAYGITDSDLSPVGESPHGLGIRINIENMTAEIATEYGFSQFNDYTYTYEGTYSWNEVTPGDLEVFVPEVTPVNLSTIDGVAAGGGVFLFTQRGWAAYMAIMQGIPWVTSGILDVRLVPSWVVSGGGDSDNGTQVIPATDPSDPMWDLACAIPVYVDAVTSGTATETVLADWRTTALSAIGASSIWRKLLTSQFTDLLVGNGDSMTSFHPDQWDADDIVFEAVSGAAHGTPSIRVVPQGYNDLGAQMSVETPFGGRAGVLQEGLGIATSDTAIADLGVFAAAYTTYESWSVQFRQRELAQDLGITGANLALGVAGATAGLGGVQAGGQGAIEGSTVKGVVGANEIGGVVGGISGLAGGATGLISASMQAANTIELLDVSTDGSFDIGAYQLGIAGMLNVYNFDTWVDSLQARSGAGAASTLTSAWRAILAQAFQVIIAMPSAERVKRLVSEWQRYGYMIGQAFDPGQLNVMEKFSYWKTSGALITGSTPQEKRRTIAQAFDNGVTVWTNLADIGTDVTAENTPLTGITY